MVEEVKSFNELVSGNVANLVLGNQKSVLVVPERMCEEDVELINHLDHPKDRRLVWAVALLKVCLHGS